MSLTHTSSTLRPTGLSGVPDVIFFYAARTPLDLMPSEKKGKCLPAADAACHGFYGRVIGKLTG